jgi:flagellar protein FliL
MADAENPEEEVAEDSPAPPAGGGTPKLLVVLAVLNLGATGFLGFRTMSGGNQATPAPAVAHAAAPVVVRDAGVPLAKPGPVVPIDTFVVNLNEPGQSRYLKATFELQVATENAAKQIDKDKRAVRDEILRYLSGLAVADTLGEENKQKIQEALVARLEKVLGGEKVQHLFFSEFVVQ